MVDSAACYMILLYHVTKYRICKNKICQGPGTLFDGNMVVSAGMAHIHFLLTVTDIMTAVVNLL